jgi:hypothetical protein
MNLQEIQEAIKNLPEDQRGLISDGYHTFEELYEHRCMLAVGLANELDAWSCGEHNLASANSKMKSIFKARKHHDGTGYDGWFLLCFSTSEGQISYHLPEKYWDMLCIDEYDISPVEFDGHTPADVLDRLQKVFS